MNNREINPKQLIIYIWEKRVILIITIIICAVLMLFVMNKKHKANIASASSYAITQINHIIKQNREAFYTDDVTRAQNTEMLPVDNTFISFSKLYIEFADIYDTTSDYKSLIEGYQNDAESIFVSDNSINGVISKLDLDNDEEMKLLQASEIRWLINTRFEGTNVLQVSVTDIDPQRAKDINEALIEEFKITVEDYDVIKSVEVIDEPSLPIGARITNNIQSSVGIKTIIKYILVGIIVGLIVGCGLLFFGFVLDDTIRTDKDIMLLGVESFGSISKNNEKTIKTIAYKILVNNSSRIAVVSMSDANNDEIIKDIEAELVKCGKKTKQIVVNDDHTGDINKNRDDDDKVVFYINKNTKNSSEYILCGHYCDSVVLFSKYGKTKIIELKQVIDDVNKSEKKLFGVVIDKEA